MDYDYAVMYTITAQPQGNGKFSVPKKVTDFLGLHDGDKIRLVIESSKGKIDIVTYLKSGKEIYGDEISKHVKSGEQIRVTASKPLS